MRKSVNSKYFSIYFYIIFERHDNRVATDKVSKLFFAIEIAISEFCGDAIYGQTDYDE